jgi:hypothetical protein
MRLHSRRRPRILRRPRRPRLLAERPSDPRPQDTTTKNAGAADTKATTNNASQQQQCATIAQFAKDEAAGMAKGVANAYIDFANLINGVLDAGLPASETNFQIGQKTELQPHFW